MQESSDLILITLPPTVIRRRTFTAIRNHRIVAGDIPPVLRLGCASAKFVADLKLLRRSGHPIEKGLPHGFCFRARQSLTDHRNLQRVVRSNGDLLSPMRVEELFGVKPHELSQ